MTAPGPRIFIIVYAGYNLVGDEAVVEGELAALLAAVPSARFTVASHAPEATRERFGVDSCSIESSEAIIRAILDADVVVVGGGGVFNEYADFRPLETLHKPIDFCLLCTQAPLLAAALGKPCVLYSVGVEPLRSQALIEAVRTAFATATFACVRDSTSAAELLRIGVPRSQFSVTCDPASICARPSVDRAGILAAAGLSAEKFTISLTLRHWDLGIGRLSPDEQPWEAQLQAALNMFCDRYDAQLFLLPSQVLEGWAYSNDIVFYERFIKALTGPAAIYRGPMAPSDIIAAVSTGNLSVAMRHHGVIFAALTATPFVTLGYSNKAFGAARDAGMGDYAVDLGASGDEIFSALQALYENRDALRERLTDYRDVRLRLQAQAASQVAAALQLSARGIGSSLPSGALAAWLEAGARVQEERLPGHLMRVFDEAVIHSPNVREMAASFAAVASRLPADPVLPYYRAICLSRMGQAQEAIDLLDQALALGGDPYWCRFHKAQAYRSLGDEAGALREMTLAEAAK